MKRLECLDGLRGVLAVYVLLGHMAPFAPLPGLVQSAVSHGSAAVDLFFALSGLVITQSLDRLKGRAVPFLIARAARIFPVFLPVFALSVLIQPLSCGFEAMSWIGPDSAAREICTSAWPRSWRADVAAHLTMTHGLFPDGVMPDVWISLLGSAWSLSAEWQFYLLALLVRDRSRLIGLLLSLSAAAAAWRAMGLDGWQFSRAFLPNQAQYFALGVASMGAVRGEQGAIRRLAAVLAAALAVCATQGQAGKLLPPLVWVVCLAAQAGGRVPILTPIRSALSSRISVYLGAISYCVYLVNEPIHKLIGNGLSRFSDQDPTLFTLLWLPAAVGLPLAVSAVLHAWLEMPALRWGRGFSDRFVAMSLERT